MNSAGATQHAKRLRRTPVWTASNEDIKEVLLRAFPKLATNERQRLKAGRWLQVIHFYYRMGWTRSRVAEEMKISERAVKDYIQTISRAANGRRTSTGKPRSGRPRGRPWPKKAL